MLKRIVYFVIFLAAASLADVKAAEFSRLEIATSAGGKHAFNVELAATPEDRDKGLMFRRALPSDSGMLFDFGMEQRVSMWMKNTLIPLDMLFIDAHGKIVNIAERTVPHSLESIPARSPVRYVLEVSGGTAARLGIRPGDHVRHKIIAP